MLSSLVLLGVVLGIMKEPPFVKPIALTRSFKLDLEKVVDNDEWWLCLPASWLVAFVLSSTLSMLVVLWSIGEILIYVVSWYYGSAADLPLVVSICSLCFLIQALIMLRESLKVARNRSSRIREDPRVTLIINYVQCVRWWNDNVNNINDRIAAGGDPDVLSRILLSYDEIGKNGRLLGERLKIAPLGTVTKGIATPPPGASLEELRSAVRGNSNVQDPWMNTGFFRPPEKSVFDWLFVFLWDKVVLGVRTRVSNC